MARKKYIPHLAEFYFKPDHSWNIFECETLYRKKHDEYFDSVKYSDCIGEMKKMDSESVDCIVADPPFGIDFTGKESIYNRKKENVVEGYREISDYRNFSLEWIMELPRIMKETSSAFIVSGWTNLEYVLEAIRKAGLNLINHIVWKYQFGPFASKKFVSSHYHILWVVKNPKKYYFNRIQHYNLDVWDTIRTYKADQRKNGTKLPEGLVQRMIDFTTEPGDLVFDPFMGNGTTAITAKMNYRHYFGFEINRKMEPIIENNLSMVSVGEGFVPYDKRLLSPEELYLENQNDPDYCRAYDIYLKQIGQNA